MSADEKEGRTFNEDQQKMFGDAEANQAGQPVRPREANAGPLDVSFEPPPTRADEAPEAEPRLTVVPKRAEGGADITGGTDKYGPGGMGDKEHHTHAGTGAQETGDIAGASTTHAGAGGEMGQTGGTGTAPNTVSDEG